MRRVTEGRPRRQQWARAISGFRMTPSVGHPAPVHAGDVVFVAHRPPEPLRSAVAVAHGYRVPANPTGLHRGLPSRHLTLVVELQAPLRVAGLGEPVAAHGVAGGLHTTPAMIDASVPQEGMQYGLTPLGTRALLGVPAGELSGLAVDLCDLLGRSAAAFLDRILEAPGWGERFGLLDELLLRRLGERTPGAPAEVAVAWRLILSRRGRVRVGDLAAEVGWSRRHLAEQFRGITGLTPKEAARIARFEAARQLLLRTGRPPLGDVAARCGYADQSHLAREWRSLAGCSVGTWLREELPFLQDGPAADAPASGA